MRRVPRFPIILSAADPGGFRDDADSDSNSQFLPNVPTDDDVAASTWVTALSVSLRRFLPSDLDVIREYEPLSYLGRPAYSCPGSRARHFSPD